MNVEAQDGGHGSGEKRPSHPPLRRARILIAEDDPVLRELVTVIVEGLGHEAVAVADGNAVLAAVGDRVPDLFLLDVVIPDPDGVELCRRLKADPATRSAPVLLVTGTGPEQEEAGLAAGADGFLRKPFTQRELSARIAALLGRRGPNDTDRPG